VGRPIFREVGHLGTKKFPTGETWSVGAFHSYEMLPKSKGSEKSGLASKEA